MPCGCRGVWAEEVIDDTRDALQTYGIQTLRQERHCRSKLHRYLTYMHVMSTGSCGVACMPQERHHRCLWLLVAAGHQQCMLHG
jgi:hypothetical protein